MTSDHVQKSTVEGKYYIEHLKLKSEFLDRFVQVDIYLPQNVPEPSSLHLLLVNDGQDLPKMPFAPMLNRLVEKEEIEPLVAVGMHCNEDRKLEYGTADELDYQHRGSRARYHRKFVLKELIPFLKHKYHVPAFRSVSFAGFSLGGLSAMDIVWKHPEIFDTAAVFSGSFWWRSKSLGHGYNEETDRIMHRLVRNGAYAENLSFFFEAGCHDEKMDRNQNGIIDSIDDTLDLISELAKKGYVNGRQIKYLELPEGRHDVHTWALAFPDFLKWKYGL
jgi:enterochelin esterase-like enzyme